MSDRFYVENLAVGKSVALSGAEAHHLAHVMRGQAGDEVVLFDGSGAEFPARILRVARSEVRLDILSRNEVDRELPVCLTLGVSSPRGERQKWLVEKATELGVTVLVPLAANRTVAEPGAGSLDKLRRTVIEASKQCGRNRLMQIHPVQDVTTYLRAAPPAATRLLGHPGTAGDADTIANQLPARPIYIAVGPEGGFAADEVDVARSLGWQLVDLGSRTLRIETAALALTAMVVRSLSQTPK